METKQIHLGIPFFNDGTAFSETLASLEKMILVNLNSKEYKICTLIYNDGSSSQESERLFDLVQKSEYFRSSCEIYTGETNYGYGFAVRTLQEIALEKKSDLLIIIDSELSMRPEDISSLVKLWWQPEYLKGENPYIFKPSRFSTPSGSENILGVRKLWSWAGNKVSR